MNATCAYHPDRISEAACVECGTPICNECQVLVKDKPVCQRCVETIRSRVADEIGDAVPAATSTGATDTPIPTADSPPAPWASRPTTESPTVPTSPGTVYRPPGPVAYKAPNPARLLIGIVLGILIGAVGAVVWEKVTFSAHVEIGYLNILVGFGVGYGVMVGSGQRGWVPAILSGIIAFGAMMFGYYLLTGEEVAKLAAERGVPVPTITLDAFLDVLKHLEPLDWVFVAIGVYGGVRTPLRSSVRR